eukprot:CAMPEP_0117447548 /NCGR_PEP_ID=MMETSP0759-20121206/6934_1 /TAXON_ID=63605 /ORGANISM="Percolomonas cosmopolitus, Strain WS" /LENGTH=192 /DNA_ID=CAMNT_0005239891 /DNA_START=111 /DNA_END=689 /DNA_ORIENTATION=-
MSLAQTNQESMEGVLAGAQETMHRRRRQKPRNRQLDTDKPDEATSEKPIQKKSGAWDVSGDGDSSASTQVSADATIPTMDAHEKEHYQKLMAQDDEDEIPVIPSLKDEADEKLQREIADAPDVVTSQVQGLGELDSQLFTLPTNKTDAHIDLSVLTSVLSVPEQILEEDLPWTDHMFRELLHTVGTDEQQKA